MSPSDMQSPMRHSGLRRLYPLRRRNMSVPLDSATAALISCTASSSGNSILMFESSVLSANVNLTILDTGRESSFREFERTSFVLINSDCIRMLMAGIRLPEHSHCRFCGDPVPFGQEYCNEECRSGEEEREASEKRKEYVFYGSAAAIVIALVAVRMLLL